MRTEPSGSAPHLSEPHVLREYSLLADGERGAIVGPHGDLAWMCFPRWDSGSIFSALMGGFGGYQVCPTARHTWGGYYEEGSMIWRNRWVTNDEIIECRDALLYPTSEHRAVILRQIIAVQGTADVTVTLNPRGEYDQQHLRELHRRDQSWTGCVAGTYLRWNGAANASARSHRETLVVDLSVPEGQHHDLVLELSTEPLSAAPPSAQEAWRTTEQAWAQAVPELASGLSARDARRSFAVLTGLTSAGGGMVAAATTSLPERIRADRNYDYRYVWIRDQCYAGQAVAAHGPHRLLDDAVSFVAARLNDDGAHMSPAYTTSGNPVPDEHHFGLPGYPGSTDVAGNWVNGQFQLDAFGEALLLFATADRLDRLDPQHWRAAEAAAAAIAARWTESDAGIWELDDRAWTHSRLTAVAGLRAVASATSSAAQASDWLALADHITADTATTSIHSTGRWQRSPGDDKTDAALLLAGLRGAIPADDPRTIATLDAYLAALTQDGYAYRFQHDERPLGDAEGSFLLCGFLVALSLKQQGRDVEARGWFERTAAACGPPQLFSEEYDAGEHQLRGNLPQAFVHALMIEAAARLS